MKVGDRIRVVKLLLEADENIDLEVGDEGIIKATTAYDDKVIHDIVFDKEIIKSGENLNFNSDGTYSMFEYQLEDVSKKSIEAIIIMECDSDMFISLNRDGEAVSTSDLTKMTVFKDVEDAKEFASMKLDELETYDIVKVTVENIKFETIDTINY